MTGEAQLSDSPTKRHIGTVDGTEVSIGMNIGQAEPDERYTAIHVPYIYGLLLF